MSSEAASHVPIFIAIAGVMAAIVIAALRSWGALTKQLREAIAEALRTHTELETVKWDEIERRLGRLEEKVDRLLLGKRSP